MSNQQKKSHISPSTRRYQPSARAEFPRATKLVAVMNSKYITVDETKATSLHYAEYALTPCCSARTPQVLLLSRFGTIAGGSGYCTWVLLLAWE